MIPFHNLFFPCYVKYELHQDINIKNYYKARKNKYAVNYDNKYKKQFNDYWAKHARDWDDRDVYNFDALNGLAYRTKMMINCRGKLPASFFTSPVAYYGFGVKLHDNISISVNSNNSFGVIDLIKTRPSIKNKVRNKKAQVFFDASQDELAILFDGEFASNKIVKCSDNLIASSVEIYNFTETGRGKINYSDVVQRKVDGLMNVRFNALSRQYSDMLTDSQKSELPEFLLLLSKQMNLVIVDPSGLDSVINTCCVSGTMTYHNLVTRKYSTLNGYFRVSYTSFKPKKVSYDLSSLSKSEISRLMYSMSASYRNYINIDDFSSGTLSLALNKTKIDFFVRYKNEAVETFMQAFDDDKMCFVIANKGTGKTSFFPSLEIPINNYADDVDMREFLVIDSDDYGRFIHFVIQREEVKDLDTYMINVEKLFSLFIIYMEEYDREHGVSEFEVMAAEYLSSGVALSNSRAIRDNYIDNLRRIYNHGSLGYQLFVEICNQYKLYRHFSKILIFCHSKMEVTYLSCLYTCLEIRSLYDPSKVLAGRPDSDVQLFLYNVYRSNIFQIPILCFLNLIVGLYNHDYLPSNRFKQYIVEI